jgi:hypothetical protein
MKVIDQREWSERLRSLALGVLGREFLSGGPEVVRGFADEFANRPETVEPLAAFVLGHVPRPAGRDVTPDVRLLYALHDTKPEIEALLGPDAAGPVLELPADLALEVATEAQLAALHGLDRLAQVHGREDWAARVEAAASWLIREIQPDNATNHPWGVHVFLRRGAREAESRMYAETLLHNCQVTLGRPDRVSALILLDSAAALGA